MSYSHADQAVAMALRQRLNETDHRVFMDVDSIEAGEKWRSRLFFEIGEVDAVLALVSPNFVTSAYCLAEVSAAKALRRDILPLVFDSGDPSQLPVLDELHYLRWTPDGFPPAPQDGNVPWVNTDGLLARLRKWDPRWPGGMPDDEYSRRLLKKPQAGAQYPGLAPLGVDQWWAFFGREQETEQVARLLRAEETTGNPVVVFGPPGCGKSSLVQAGVLPRMMARRGWFGLEPIVVGEDTLRSLREALTVAGGVAGVVAGGVVGGVAGSEDLAVPSGPKLADAAELPQLVASVLERRGAPTDGTARLLVVLEGVEEALLSGGGSGVSALTMLADLARSSQIRLLATVRSEHLDRLLRLPGLADSRTSLLTPLPPGRLREVIVRPAAQVGLDVAEDLVTELVADTREGVALPLLAFVLDKLARQAQNERADRLEVFGYREIGKVTDALSRSADATLADRISQSNRSREQVLGSLLRLIVLDDEQRPVLRRQAWDELSADSQADLRAFVDARLLTTSVDDRGVSRVRVAHEALLSVWDAFRDAVVAQQALLTRRETIRLAVREWMAAGRSTSHLWSFDRLSSALLPLDGGRVRVHLPGGPTRPLYLLRHAARRTLRVKPHLPATFELMSGEPEALRFLADSYRHSRSRRYRWECLLVVMVLSLSALTGWAVLAQAQAREERCEAISQQLIQTARSLRDDQPMTALQLGVVAYAADCPSRAAADNLVAMQHLSYSRFLDDLGSAVHAVAYDPVTDLLAVATQADGVHVVDLRNGNGVRLPFPAEPTPVFAVAFASGHGLLATGGRDGTVTVWDIDSGTRQADVRHSDEPVNALAFTPDGATLVSGGQDGVLRAWDARTGGEQGAPMRDNGQPVNGIAISGDGRLLAAAGADGDIDVWASAEGRIVDRLQGHTGPVRVVAFAPDGTTLASGADDASVRLWDVKRLAWEQAADDDAPPGSASPAMPPISPIPAIPAIPAIPSAPAVLAGHNDPVRALAFTPDGAVLASGADDATVRLWDVPSKLPRRTLAGSPAAVTGLAFRTDGVTLAGTTLDGKLGTWDVGNAGGGSPLGMISVAVHPNDTSVAVAVPGQPIMVWDMAGRVPPVRLEDSADRSTSDAGGLTGQSDAVEAGSGSTADDESSSGSDVTVSISFSADGSLLAAPLGDDVGIWRTNDGVLLHRLSDHAGQVYAVALSPDGRYVASGGRDQTIRVWDTTRFDRLLVEEPLDTVAEYFGAVRAIAFSKVGFYLASGGDDSVVSLARIVAPGNVSAVLRGYYHLPPVEAVAFNPDGTLLAAGSQDGSISLWAVPSDGTEPIATMTGHEQGVVSVAFDHEGRRLASASSDGEIRVRDVVTGEELLRLPTLDGATSVAFTSDGQRLVTASRDGVPRLWLLDPALIATDLCEMGVLSADLGWQRHVTDEAFGQPCPSPAPSAGAPSHEQDGA